MYCYRKSIITFATLLLTISTIPCAFSQGGAGRETTTAPKSTPKKTTPAKKKPTASRPRVVKPKAESEPATNGAEVTFWNSIKNSTNAEDFRDYLRKYPTGQFVTEAQTQITTIEAATKPKPTATPTPPPTPTPTPQPQESRATLNETLNWLKEQIDNRATGTIAFSGTMETRITLRIVNECTVALEEPSRTTTIPLRDLSDFEVGGPAVGNGGFSYVLLTFNTIGVRSTITIDDKSREAQLMGGAWKHFNVGIQFRGSDKELATRVGKSIKHAGKLCREKEPF